MKLLFSFALLLLLQVVAMAQTQPEVTQSEARFAKVAPQPQSKPTIYLADIITQNIEVIGPLGRPMHEQINVTIKKPDLLGYKGDLGATAEVHRVNGFVLKQPVRIDIEEWTWAKNLPKFQENQTYELRGYQDFRVIAANPQQALRENNVPPVQSGGPSIRAVLVLTGVAR